MQTLITAKNMNQLKKILKQGEPVCPLSLLPFNPFFAEKKSMTIIDLERIREYSSVLTTSSSLMLGLGTKLQRVTELRHQVQIPEVILDIIRFSFVQSSLSSLQLLDLFGIQKQFRLLKLAFCLLNAKLLVLKQKNLSWLSMRDYVNTTRSVDNTDIPLSIRLDSNIKIVHTVTMKKSLYQSTPSFAVIGVMECDEDRKIIDIRFACLKDETHYFFSPKLHALKSHTLPIKPSIINKTIKNTAIPPFLTAVEQGYFLETLFSLIEPTITK